MTADEFAGLCAAEKRALHSEYLDPASRSTVATEICALELPATQSERLKTILDAALTDAFYTVLLALDGAASLAGKQALYRLADAQGNEITGQLEQAAWQHFHGGRK